MIGLKWRLSLIAASCVLVLGFGHAELAYPDRPVHIVIGFAPGGGNDFLARYLGAKLSEKWGQPVIVENREGASGTIAEDMVAHAPPDGYAIAMVPNTHTITPSLMKLNYDPIKSFAPITLMVEAPDLLLVNPSYLSVNSVKELIALAKSKPGTLNFGSPGPGSPPFLEMGVFMQRAGIKMVNVSYKGGVAAMVTALLGGEVQTMFGSISTAGEQVKAGKFRALAFSANFRSPSMPDVPTMAEAADMPGYNEGSWYGFLAPAGTPREIVSKLRDDIAEAMKLPDFKQTLAARGYFPVGSSPEEFDSFVKAEIEKVANVTKMLDTKN